MFRNRWRNSSWVEVLAIASAYGCLALFCLGPNDAHAENPTEAQSTQKTDGPSGEGANSGGGGDAANEMRVDDIRADLMKWIIDGGHNGLILPEGMTSTDYAARMLT